MSEEGGNNKRYVTLGWDMKPKVLTKDGLIYPNQEVELILHRQFYPNWPEEKWPVDPDTGEKLEIEPMQREIDYANMKTNERRSSFKRLLEKIIPFNPV